MYSNVPTVYIIQAAQLLIRFWKSFPQNLLIYCNYNFVYIIDLFYTLLVKFSMNLLKFVLIILKQFILNLTADH